MQNAAILATLQQIAQGYALLGDGWRAAAFAMAIIQLKELARRAQLARLTEAQLRERPGIGKGVASTVVELAKTGRSRRLEQIRAAGIPDLSELIAIHGVGPKTALLLHRQFKIRTMAQLLTAAKRHGADPLLISLVDGMADGDRVPRAAVTTALRPVLRKLRALPYVNRVEPCGSYRRAVATVRDIDLLVDLAPGCVERFKAACQVIFKANVGGRTKKLTTVLSVAGSARSVDIVITDSESWGAALNYLTGSKEHNVWLRAQAKEKGYKLNEKGLYKGTRRVAGREEKDIFTALGIAYLEPSQRTGFYAHN